MLGCSIARPFMLGCSIARPFMLGCFNCTPLHAWLFNCTPLHARLFNCTPLHARLFVSTRTLDSMHWNCIITLVCRPIVKSVLKFRYEIIFEERLIEVIDYQSSKILPTIQEASQSGSAVSSAVSDKENKSLNSTRKNGINTELSLKEDLNTKPVDDVNNSNRASPRISPRITLQTSGQTESAGMMSTSKTFSNSIGADSMNLDVTKSSNFSEEK